MSGNSSPTSYISVSQFLNRKDWRAVAQLVMDDGTQATEASLQTNANLEAILMESSGEVEASLVASGRYTVEQLQTVNGVSSAYLQGIIADIAMYNLFGRRDAGDFPETVSNAFDRAWEKINAIRDGKTVLTFEENIEAGLPENQYMQVQDLLRLNLFSTRCERTLGIRNAFRRGSF